MALRIPRNLRYLVAALRAGVARLDFSLSPLITLRRLSTHPFTIKDSIYIFHILFAIFWLVLMQQPGFPLKLLIPLLYTIALLIPLTSQFFIPATPVFSWILCYFSSRFIPTEWRPSISVLLLPTLESVLYGANISDILTRFTHPILDIVAWLPYGILHFTLPFVVAAILFLFRAKPVLHLWAKVFGYMNLFGVIVQIIFPCAAPWYEVIHGLTPANYSMKGSPGGLVRIDALFGSNGYTVTFSNSPVVFGAFPSLHAGNATLEALFMSHFFPQYTKWFWGYAGILYWATMYLTHHYLIDVVGGACMATIFFYAFLPDELRSKRAASAPPANLQGVIGGGRGKYEEYGLESPRMNGRARYAEEFYDLGESDLEGEDISYYRSPLATPGGPNGHANGHAGYSNFQNGAVAEAGGIHHGAGAGAGGGGGDAGGNRTKRSHKHTASIVSLIRGEERTPEDGWSPITSTFPSAGTAAGVGGGNSASSSSTAAGGTTTSRPGTPSGRRRVEDV